MASPGLGSLPSLRRQQLLSEFAGLKQACLEGIFVSLTPGDPSLWSGVIFARDGPYAPAVLRFQVLFPSLYPRLPPLVTFSTDIFHPLVTPLSTYMYTSDIKDNGTVSASDDELLPAGGFSLRHGFPQWFGRRKSNASGSRQTSSQQVTGLGITMAASRVSTPASVGSPAQTLPSYMRASEEISICDVLRYIRSTFDNEEVLDSVPLSASGNPGAWHAWRTHRRALGKVQDDTPSTGSMQSQTQSPESPMAVTKRASVIAARHPGQWNWEGVWVDRVKKGIAASLSEPVLYGVSPGSPDDLIRFLAMEDNDVDSVKENLRRTLGNV